jgi:hypothetical protein
MNKDAVWKEIVAREKKISDGLQQPGAEEYALELHELIGGYFTLNRVRRYRGLLLAPAGVSWYMAEWRSRGFSWSQGYCTKRLAAKGRVRHMRCAAWRTRFLRQKLVALLTAPPSPRSKAPVHG